MSSREQTMFRAMLPNGGGVLPPQGVTLDIFTSGTDIGDTTSDQNNTTSPYNAFFDYSACFVLIRASELNSLVSGGKTLTGIEIENGVSGTNPMYDFRIDIAHTTEDFLLSGAPMETHFDSQSSQFTFSGKQTCFDATYFPTANAWNSVSFSNNFIYDGTSNIVMLMTNRSGQWVIASRARFKYGTRSGTSFRAALYQDDWTTGGPFTSANSQPMITTDSTTAGQHFPNLKIKY